MLYLASMKHGLLYIFVFTFQWANAQIAGRTTGPLPYLEYGPGDDRLGGAKMTYLDTNIAVKVIDSAGTDYIIQLSARHTAYLPKQNFKADTSLKWQPHYLSASSRVWGDEHYDYVSVGLPERLPYRSIQQINPSRIVVDIFGVTSNTNWITQLKTVRRFGFSEEGCLLTRTCKAFLL